MAKLTTETEIGHYFDCYFLSNLAVLYTDSYFGL